MAWPVGTYGQKGGKDCPTALAALVVAASLSASPFAPFAAHHTVDHGPIIVCAPAARASR